MGSFSTSLSGLTAAESALNVISNNLANLNTTAYKEMTPNFADLFYQFWGDSGSGNPIQVGDGATISSISTNFTQGNPESTGIDTDMAIQGNGFFVVQNNGVQEYTRAGNFTANPSGYLVDSNGAYVMGYGATNGVINSSATLTPVQLTSGPVVPAKATTEVEVDMNLDAAANVPATGTLTISGQPSANDTVTIGGTTYTFVSSLTSTPDEVLIGQSAADTLANLSAAISGSNGAGTTYSTGTTANTSATVTGATASTLLLQATTAGANGNSVVTTSSDTNSLSFGAATLTGGITGDGSGSFSQSMVVYDSLGVSHTLGFQFTKEATNEWTYQITIPAADVGASGSASVIGSGTLQFDGTGKLISPASNVNVSVSNLSDGAANLNFNWQLFNSQGSPNVTETGGASAASSTSQDGYSSGSLTSFNITSDGVIHGVFSNGQTTVLGQIALANFTNPEGLTRGGGNNYYSATYSSGAANIGGAGLGGRGTILGATLEQSNVDMATEFANLIMAERDYQANAKAVTTADNITQTAINLIQP